MHFSRMARVLLAGLGICATRTAIVVFAFFGPCLALFEKSPIPTETLSRAPSVEQAMHYVHFTNAVCADNWDCPDCLLTGPNVVLVAAHEKKEYSTKATVNRDGDRNEIIVTWRGSVNVQNLVQDFHATKTATYDGIKVHTGDWNDMNTLYDEATATVLEQFETHPELNALTIVGHSLGGAEAAVYLFKLAHEGKIPPAAVEVSLYAYGMPRAGGEAFANWFNQQPFTIGRVVNHKDIIPHIMPSALGFVHFNTELWITGDDNETQFCDRNVLEDPECSNSQAPFFSIADHLKYYGVTFNECKFSVF